MARLRRSRAAATRDLEPAASEGTLAGGREGAESKVKMVAVTGGEGVRGERATVSK